MDLFPFLQQFGAPALSLEDAAAAVPGDERGVHTVHAGCDNFKNVYCQIPNLANWVAPTLNLEELEKRVAELKAVHYWLDQNSKALGATIQALEVQRIIREDGLVANVRAMGDVLERALTDRFGNHRHVGDVRGRGLFWAIELVADRATKAVFDELNAWRAAWQNKNMKAYFSHYVEDFSGDAKNAKAWREERADKIKSAKNIQVTFSDAQVIFTADDSAELKFKQHYRSGNYKDVGQKTLQFKKVDNRWLIAQEMFK